MGRRPALTKEQRLAVVRQSDKQPEWKQKQLGQWLADTFQLDFVPSQPTISIVLRAAGKPVKVRGPYKKKSVVPVKPKVVKCPRVEKAMVQWLELQIEKDEAVSVSSMQAQAQEFVDKLQVSVEGFKVSDAWVDSFMRRHVLNLPFGQSDLELTDSEQHEEDTEVPVPTVPTKKVGKTVKSGDVGKAGKVRQRVAKAFAAKKDTRTPVPAGKRKRDNREREPARQVKARR